MVKYLLKPKQEVGKSPIEKPKYPSGRKWENPKTTYLTRWLFKLTRYQSTQAQDDQYNALKF